MWNCANGTGIWDRLAEFGISTGWRGENIAWFGDPWQVFYAWFWEPTSNPTCNATIENGHRHNILNGNFTTLGVGGAGGYTVQDFSSIESITEKILAGAHYPETGGSIDFRANYFDGAAPQEAMVNIDGTCYAMSVERGSATNGTYMYSASFSNSCHEYYFIFVDSGNQRHYYPDSGSFGVNCANEWTSNRPAEGAGCGTVPPVCGNGIVESGETCDPPANCPTS